MINLSKRFDAEGLLLTLRTPYGVIWARRAVYPADAVAIFEPSVSIVSPDVINMKRPCISPLMWAFPLIREIPENACFFIFQVYTVHRVFTTFEARRYSQKDVILSI
ncbi:MAG: hypothetical protein ACXVI7_07420 [Halobacteriota archaeon]